MLAELNKFGQFLTGRMKFFWPKREQLSPVWTRVKRRQFSLDYLTSVRTLATLIAVSAVQMQQASLPRSRAPAAVMSNSAASRSWRSSVYRRSSLPASAYSEMIFKMSGASRLSCLRSTHANTLRTVRPGKETTGTTRWLSICTWIADSRASLKPATFITKSFCGGQEIVEPC